MIEVDVMDTGAPAKAQARPKQQRDALWDKILLAQLTDRRWDDYYPARTRLLHYLRIVSYRGTKPVRLTNEMAAGIGLDRHQKRICLHRLEADGHIQVERPGQQVPVVTMRQGVAS
jgi:hypothetical protein